MLAHRVESIVFSDMFRHANILLPVKWQHGHSKVISLQCANTKVGCVNACKAFFNSQSSTFPMPQKHRHKELLIKHMNLSEQEKKRDGNSQVSWIPCYYAAPTLDDNLNAYDGHVWWCDWGKNDNDLKFQH